MIPLFAPSDEPSDYSWMIVVDHLFAADAGDHSSSTDNEAGTSGPRQAPNDLIDALDRRGSEAGRRALEDCGIRTAVFKMYDDDGELYYTGVLAYRAEVEGEEHVVAGPLFDFGAPNAGCTRIGYPAHPDWAVG
ncbi:hypothetical protein [Nocardioides limicola]|uniref:hypothetical protein n=1 Tax=Nocardioides limicola TaxID=2803368 RepID=UPI00193AF0A2|nr:hypothetical protein [Nocardioides sp. DJM-14]